MMKKLMTTVMAGAVSLGSVTCLAQGVTVNAGQSYTVPSAAAASCTGCSYRWLENGNYIAGESGTEYTNQVGKGSAGRYVYTRQVNIDDCGWQNSNAFIVEVVAPSEEEPGSGSAIQIPPDAASTQTWIIDGPGGAQMWSDYIDNADCKDSTYKWSLTVPTCATITTYGGVVYNHSYMVTYGTQLCPDPWRVPSVMDVARLELNLRHTYPKTVTNDIEETEREWFLRAWRGGAGFTDSPVVGNNKDTLATNEKITFFYSNPGFFILTNDSSLLGHTGAYWWNSDPALWIGAIRYQRGARVKCVR